MPKKIVKKFNKKGTTQAKAKGARKPTRNGSPKKHFSLESKKKQAEIVESAVNLDVNRDAGEYFRTNATFEQHFEAQTVNRNMYVATLMAFDHYSIEVIANAKSRSLAAAIARHDNDLIKYLLEHNKNYGFADVLKAVSILDSGREKASLEKKIERIQNKTNTTIKVKKLGKWKNDINNLEIIRPKIHSVNCSFTGATARLIKRWVRTFTKSELEYFALNMPTESWRKLANLAHLNPVKDFPEAPWFLPFCFGKTIEQNEKVESCRHMNAENVNDLVRKYDLDYTSSVRKFHQQLTDESKKSIVERSSTKLDTILWYYEELQCSKVDDVIRARLEQGEKIELGYGKLMERLLMFKEFKDKNPTDENSKSSIFSLVIPQAEKDLKRFKSSVPEPVAILGDASSSMDVAIRTATIISSLLTAICSAKLSFFNHKNFEPSNQKPKNVAEVLELAYNTKASGSTAPAASLVPYFDSREIIKTFIIVTDEEENTEGKSSDGKSWRFYDLFMEYRKYVYPATLIFISFLNSQHSKGQMYSQFLANGVPNIEQFKFNRSRPDLTKLDTILGKICSKSSESFGEYIEKREAEIRLDGLLNSFQKEKYIPDNLMQNIDLPDQQKSVVF